MKFTEQEWMYIEDLQLIDDTLAALQLANKRDAQVYNDLQALFDQILLEKFPDLDDDIYVLLEVFPDIDSDDELVVREVMS